MDVDGEGNPVTRYTATASYTGTASSRYMGYKLLLQIFPFSILNFPFFDISARIRTFGVRNRTQIMAKEYTPSSRNREAFEALTETAGNVPPQAVELEEAVLGALMLEKDSIIAVQIGRAHV